MSQPDDETAGASTRLLRELLDDAAPHFDAIHLEDLGRVRARMRLRSWTAAGSVTVVLALAAALTLVNSAHRTHRATAPSQPPNASQLADFAKRAPCDRLDRFKVGRTSTAATVSRFGTVAVVQCVFGTRRYPGAGEWAITTRSVLVGGMDALVAALEAPDQTTTPSDIICSGVLVLGPNILLVDRTGHYLRPRVPTVAPCDEQQPAFTSALEATTWRTISVARDNQTESQAAIDSGCAMQWKNPTMLGIAVLHSASAAPVLTEHPDAKLKVCLYGRSSDPDAGTFQRAIRLTADQSHDLRSALAGAGPTSSRTCPAEPGFAVVFAGSQWLEVELGGCWRILHGATIGTAQPDIIKRVLGLP